MTSTHSNSKYRLWFIRFLIGLVFISNIQCAVAFLSTPRKYVSNFELSGTTGEAMVRALGLLFVMWNVPYFMAILHPQKNHISLYEAIIMQAIGLIGETLLLLTLQSGHGMIFNTTTRFIIFDGLGLVILVIAGWLNLKKSNSNQ
jgi:hypothetical protein